MKNFWGKLLVILVVVGVLFLCFGRVEAYNEELQGQIHQEYMGQAFWMVDKDGARLEGGIFGDEGWMVAKSIAEEYQNIENGTEVTILMDFDKVMLYYEKRTILTGRLLEQSEGLIYRTVGITILTETYDGDRTASFDHEMAVFGK